MEASRSPLVSVRTFLQSIIGALVLSRSSLTIDAVIIGKSLLSGEEEKRTSRRETERPCDRVVSFCVRRPSHPPSFGE